MAANKHINSGVNVVIGAYCSSATEPAQIPLMDAQIVQITPASTNERLTAKGYKYFFRMPPRDDVQAWSTVQFLENKLKAKTLALIDDKQTYTAGLTANIKKFAKENDKIKIVAHKHITPCDSDFTAVLTKLKRINPDVIYMSVYQPEGSKMIQQVRKLGLESTFMSEDAVYHPKFLEVGGPSAEGVYLTFAKAPETPEREQFIKTYKAMWKAKAVGSYAYYAYDAGMMALAAADGRVADGWWRKHGHRLSMRDLGTLLADEPEIIVVGAGIHGRMLPETGLPETIQDLGIELIIAPNDQAVKDFNRLLASRRTAGGFHLTC